MNQGPATSTINSSPRPPPQQFGTPGSQQPPQPAFNTRQEKCLSESELHLFLKFATTLQFRLFSCKPDFVTFKIGNNYYCIKSRRVVFKKTTVNGIKRFVREKLEC